jgi:hypothetical protein
VPISTSVLLAASLLRAQEIGANFNHDPEIIDLSLLKRTPVQWIRTTPYIFEYLNGEKNSEKAAGLARVIGAHQAGYKVAFGFRWDFKKNHLRIPAPGSAEEKRYFETAARMLERVGGHIEILKLGNEPNLETMDADLRTDASGTVPLVRFSERLLTEVVEPFYRSHGSLKRPHVYVGSLPALFEPGMQQLPGVLGLIEMAESNKAIAGLSIHLHIATERQMEQAFQFVRARMPKKPIIVPEFSLHRLYVKHLSDALGEPFAKKYKRDPNMRLHEWYSLANQHKVGVEEWSAMFASRDWFPPHFMKTFYQYFQKYGVRLATHGFMSQYAPAKVPANGSAWFINPIFPGKTLPANTPNPLWFDDFVEIVKQGSMMGGG